MNNSAPPIDKVLSKLEGVRLVSDYQWQALCPAHNDNSPSLSIHGQPNASVLICCQAGCPTPDVLRAIDLTMKDLFPEDRREGFATRNGQGSTIVAAYDYRDESGKLIFQAVRFEPKDFRQRKPKPGGGWIWSVKGVKPVPYRLPELKKAEAGQTVFVCEGEKDVDRLASTGVVATCNAGGAGKWKKDHAQYLEGRAVAILADNDDAGRKHATQVARSLVALATSIKIIELPDLLPKGDVSDWLDAGGTVEQLKVIVASTQEWKPTEASGNDLPKIRLPGGERTISATGGELGELLGAKQTHFNRGETIVRLGADERGEPMLCSVTSAELASDFEAVAQLVKLVVTKERNSLQPATCSKSAAELIAASRAFANKLPGLKTLSRSPVLVERGNKLVEVVGYDGASGVLAQGEPVENLSVDDGRELLCDSLAGFRFASPSDESRALAAIITPGLLFGGLLPSRAPIDLGEADQSQSGKGYRNKLTAAYYRHTTMAISQQRYGVGSIEESFDRALIAGRIFISLDNIRGRVDSQKIESFSTEDTYYARCAYMPNTAIDPRRVYLMFTSNKADVTTDLANRCSCVRILKQPDGFQFPVYAEGDILEHIRANQPRYLGAVFAVVRTWYAAGRPRTNETRHDFRGWAQTLDWIVQNLLGAAPLIDGHRETQLRMTNPAMNWLRDVALVIARQGELDRWLIAAELLEAIDADGGVEVPGLKDGADVEDEAVRKAVLQQIGRRLGRCFGQSEKIELDGLIIERSDFVDQQSRQRHQYRIVRQVSPNALVGRTQIPEAASLSGREEHIGNHEQVISPDAPPDGPLMRPLVKPRVSPDPPNDSCKTHTRGRTRTRTHEAVREPSGEQGAIGESDSDNGHQDTPKAEVGREVILE